MKKVINLQEFNYQALRQWLGTTLGSKLLTLEIEVTTELLKNMQGFRALLLGEIAFKSALEKSGIVQCVNVHPDIEYDNDLLPIGSRQDKLAVDTESIEVAYLPHCLEMLDNPHEVLRESYRVLVPEGNIIISGFNPWSLWGLRKSFSGSFIAVHRIKDWLALLGFDDIIVKFTMYQPPVITDKFNFFEKLGRELWPVFGGVYVIVAKKCTATLTPVKQQWQATKITATTGLAEPQTRNRI